MRLLIIKLSSIGDVVHTLPALSALKSALPNTEIDWIVEESAGEILRGSKLIKNLYVVKNRGWSHSFDKSREVTRELKKRNYDIVIDFQGLLKSALWVLASGGKRKIGFSNYREFSSFFLNEKLPAYDKNKHAVDRYLDLARYVIEGQGRKLGPIKFDFPINDKTKENVDKLLSGLGLEGKEFFVVAPVARWTTKMWKADSFAEVIKEVTTKYNLHCLVAGAPDDFEYCQDIANMVGSKAANICSKTSLKDFAQLAGMAKFSLTVDSGPMHISAAMGTPTIAVFGATSKERTGPYGEGNVVIRAGVSCSPCFSRVCLYENKKEYMQCMEKITAEEVVSAINEVIGRSSGE